jgi:hypothetical protein
MLELEPAVMGFGAGRENLGEERRVAERAVFKVLAPALAGQMLLRLDDSRPPSARTGIRRYRTSNS